MILSKQSFAFLIVILVSGITNDSFSQTIINNNSSSVNGRSSSISSGTSGRAVRGAVNIYNPNNTTVYVSVSCGRGSNGTISIPPRNYGYCKCSSGVVRVSINNGQGKTLSYNLRHGKTVQFKANPWSNTWYLQ